MMGTSCKDTNLLGLLPREIMDFTPSRVRINADDYDTATSDLQRECEDECSSFLVPLHELPAALISDLRRLNFIEPASLRINLLKEKHAAFCIGGMNHLSGGWAALDARYLTSQRRNLLWYTIH